MARRITSAGHRFAPEGVAKTTEEGTSSSHQAKDDRQSRLSQEEVFREVLDVQVLARLPIISQTTDVLRKNGNPRTPTLDDEQSHPLIHSKYHFAIRDRHEIDTVEAHFIRSRIRDPLSGDTATLGVQQVGKSPKCRPRGSHLDFSGRRRVPDLRLIHGHGTSPGRIVLGRVGFRGPVLLLLQRLGATRVRRMLSELGEGKYLLLTTFRKDGRAVATPVWVVGDGERLLAWSASDSGKVKRIRRDGAVLVGPCDVRGRPSGESVPARAELLDRSGTDRVRGLIGKKYGVMGKLTLLGSRIRRGADGSIGIAISASTGG